MQKTKIEWTDYTWNPIKGICPVGCWYCYARRMYQRFKWNPELNLVSYNELQTPRKIKKSSKIFICSTIEFFHPDIHPSWREVIFDVIRKCPQHTFQILTKFPQNIDRPMPPNVWLGVTVTGEIGKTWKKTKILSEQKAKIKFISYEPALAFDEYCYMDDVDWIILGRLTGFGKKHNPKRNQIKAMVSEAMYKGIPIFLKDNLKEIWGKSLIQEFPSD